jgi:DivIVA domain-containing protein
VVWDRHRVVPTEGTARSVDGLSVRGGTIDRMMWFFAFVVVALLGTVAVVATGRGGAMADTFDDRPDSRVQAEGPLTARDLAEVRFSTAFRGYRMSEVDSLLDRLIRELRARDEAEPDAQPSDGSA